MILVEIWNDFNITLNREQVLRRQGYRAGSPLRADITRILTGEIQQGYNLLVPRAVYCEFEVKIIAGGYVTLSVGSKLDVDGFVADLGNPASIGLSICTIGAALETRVDELFAAGDYASALMLDSVGSSAVENVADNINTRVCAAAGNRGLVAGPRFSPGYGRWSLKAQETIFRLCGGNQIGVGLTEQFMMVPRKSVSFCVGIGPAVPGKLSRCRRCGMNECHYRQGGKNEPDN